MSTADQPEPFWEKDLYKFLVDRFPKIKNDRGLFAVYSFADLIQVSGETVYKWLRSGRISARAASKIVEAAEGRILPEEIIRFVLFPAGK